MRVKLVRGGIDLGDEVVPLLAGAVHYWRLARGDWRACLVALRELGLRLVDVYVPWGVHETAAGQLELGQKDPQRDVVGFLRLAHQLGLLAIVRPGPHINAELTYFGLPERVVWDSACQARSPEGNPVILPVLPKMFPVPSYASEAYHDEVTRYFQLLAKALAPLRYPDGPIVMLQVDNEGALFFRDGAYDQDYHPDAINQYRGFLRRRYGTITALREAYQQQQQAEPSSAREPAGESSTTSEPTAAPEGDTAQPRRDSVELRFANIEPPKRFAATCVADLAWHLDWAAFQEHLLASSLGKFASALQAAGLADIPTVHNFPLAQQTTPLNAARIGEVVDLVGLDYYNRCSPSARASIAARTSELAVRCEAKSLPAYACEMGAGYAPYFPPLSERDSVFTVMCALAYGLRGFNIYMAVERDRWIGAPVDCRGRARPTAAFWAKLGQVLEETKFCDLRRRVPVRVLVPRTERRLARVMHAFGPASGALLNVMGLGAREGCVEDDLGLGYPLAIEAEVFVGSFEQALDARGVPFAVVGGEDRASALQRASWIICASSGGLGPELARDLVTAAEAGTRVTIGPRPPRFDDRMRPLAEGQPLADCCELLRSSDPASADDSVARAMQALQLPSFACDPDEIQAAVHEDEEGQVRVVFVINATETDVVARVTVGLDVQWEDGIEADRTRSEGGVLELRMRPQTVRMMVRC